MMFFRTILGLVLLVVFVMMAESSPWRRGGGSSFNHDISRMSDLRRLYNSRVVNAERVSRPLSWLPFRIGHISHSGVRVTLEDGSKWLVHKGRGFGRSSETVVVDAKHMSNKWKTVKTKNFGGSKTVSDLVRAGGTNYNLRSNNCHHASCRMMKN